MRFCVRDTTLRKEGRFGRTLASDLSHDRDNLEEWTIGVSQFAWKQVIYSDEAIADRIKPVSASPLLACSGRRR